MRIQIYGARGSIPAPANKGFRSEEFGANTTCAYVEAVDGSKHIIDAGTGIRQLGLELAVPLEAALYITHTHWDHIQGFPFFGPAYNPANRITLYGEAKLKLKGARGFANLKSGPDLEAAVANSGGLLLSVEGNGVKDVLAAQQCERNFPAPLEWMRAMDYVDFVPETGPIYDRGTVKVETMHMPHPGGCVSYKFTEVRPDGSKSVFVFNSDFEPQESDLDRIVQWWAGADIVLADAQYEPARMKDTRNPFMKGYGHSDYETDVMLAAAAGVRRLVLTHHEPKMDDRYLAGLEQRAKEHGETKGVHVQSARELDVYEV